MFGPSMRKSFGGALAASGLSGIALASGFEAERERSPDIVRAAAVSALSVESKPPVRLGNDEVLTARGGSNISGSGCSFAAGARSINLHLEIANAVSAGKRVALADVVALFDALRTERGNTITRRFYEGYATTFVGDNVRDVVVRHLQITGLYPDLVEQLQQGAPSEAPVTGAAPRPSVAGSPSIGGQSFRAIDPRPVSTHGMSFQSNSRASQIHEAICSDIRNGRAVPESVIKGLFVALSMEDISGLRDSFFVEYAKKFRSSAAVKVMIESLIPVVDGKFALPRAPVSGPRLAALRALGTSFPSEASVSERRDFFEARRNDTDLNIRALGLMLCVNANIRPAAQYLPSEIIRACQQLGYSNRLRGDEFRLGILLRESLKTLKPDWGIDAKTINQIKMPLLRRAQTVERRYPGITEALIQSSEEAYLDFLGEHAGHIRDSRESLAAEVLFGAGEKLHAVLHSAPEFHYGPAKDIAKAFRLSFDPNKHVVKGEKSPTSVVGETGYFNLLERLGRDEESGKKAVVWLNMHGNSEGVFFTRGEAEDATGGSAALNAPVSSEYISWEEEASQLLRIGGLSDAWWIVDTCEGWNYSQQVNERLITEYLKEMPIERVVAERRIPGRVIGSQCQMLSVGNVLQWYDEDLPTDKQQRLEITYSKLMFEAMQYCQAKAMGVPIENLDSIGATEKPFICTFRDFYEIDERLATAMEEEFSGWWGGREGTLFDYLKTNRIDASVKDRKLIDIDRLHREILERLKQKGHDIPSPQSVVPPIRRNSDYVNEISYSPAPIQKGSRNPTDSDVTQELYLT